MFTIEKLSIRNLFMKMFKHDVRPPKLGVYLQWIQIMKIYTLQ